MGDPREFKMPFGSYKGKTLQRIFNTDPTYLDWMLDNIEQWDILQNVQAFFKLENERIKNDARSS